MGRSSSQAPSAEWSFLAPRRLAGTRGLRGSRASRRARCAPHGPRSLTGRAPAVPASPREPRGSGRCQGLNARGPRVAQAGPGGAFALGTRPKALAARGAARGRSAGSHREAPALLGPSGGAPTQWPRSRSAPRAVAAAPLLGLAREWMGVSRGGSGGSRTDLAAFAGADRSGGGGGHRWERGALRDLRSGSGSSAGGKCAGCARRGARRYAKCVTRRAATTPAEGRARRVRPSRPGGARPAANGRAGGPREKPISVRGPREGGQWRAAGV